MATGPSQVSHPLAAPTAISGQETRVDALDHFRNRW